VSIHIMYRQLVCETFEKNVEFYSFVGGGGGGGEAAAGP
jgi:hypothetical protein